MDLSAVGLRVSHVAACPEVAPTDCAERDIPAHTHDLAVAWTRARLGAAYGLGKGLHVALELPLDLRVVEADYATLDGAPYEPPYEDIHHRDAVIAGPADGQLTLHLYRPVGRTIASGWLGSTLPLGRTEEDPFAAARNGEWHEHIQLGAGLPLVATGLSAVLPGRWGGLASTGAQIPVATNRKGYKAPLVLTANLGPSFQATPRLGLFGGGSVVVESAERWHGEAHGGRAAASVDLGAQWALSPRLVGLVQLRVPVWQHLVVHEHEEDEDGQLRQLPLMRAGLSWTSKAPSRR